MDNYIEIIQELNQELFERVGEKVINNTGYSFELSTDGYCFQISFDGILIWSSENEDREFNELENDYSPNLKEHIWRKTIEYFKSTSQILVYI